MLSNIYAKIVEAKNPIPVPEKLIRDITDRIVRLYRDACAGISASRVTEENAEELAAHFSDNIRNNYQEREQWLDFDNPISGKPMTVIVKTYGANQMRAKNPVARAECYRDNFDNINVEIGLALTPRLGSPDLLDDLKGVLIGSLIHEFVHAVEREISPSIDKSSENHEYNESYHGDMNVYYNTDYEVRAYGATAHRDMKNLVLNYLKKYGERLRDMSPEQLQAQKLAVFKRGYEILKAGRYRELFSHIQNNKKNMATITALMQSGFEAGWDEGSQRFLQ